MVNKRSGGKPAADRVGDAGRTVGTLDLHRDPEDRLHGSVRTLLNRDHLATTTDSAARANHRWKADLLDAIIDAHRDAAHLMKIRKEQVHERQCQVTMRDRGSIGTRFGALGVDVDPLMVAGCISEHIDPLLIDHEPVGRSEGHADRVLQFRGMVKNMTHIGLVPVSFGYQALWLDTETTSPVM